MATRKKAAKKTTKKKTAMKRRSTKKAELAPKDLLSNMHKDQGGGFQETTAADQTIPFLVILQSNSPQLKRTNPKYIPEAKDGMILDTVTGEVYESVLVIPVYFKMVLIEWVPREQGGGFKGIYDRNDPIRQAVTEDPNHKGRMILPNGNHLQETAQYYVIYLDANGKAQQALISMKSTALSVSRGWISRMRSLQIEGPDGRPFNPPMYSHAYEVSTAPQSNDRGDWSQWVIGDATLLDEMDLYEICHQFSKGTSSVKVDYAAQQEQETEVRDALPAPADDNGIY